MNKEHFFPEWLILRTGTDKTAIRWLTGERISALAATVPLCKKCNREFGRDLETPVSRIFDNIESGVGINDYDAELLVRWLWKIQGLGWLVRHPGQLYAEKWSLREHVLFPIDAIRPHLILGLALIRELHPDSPDYPMGLDSFNEHSSVFVSGVFMRLAVMVVFEPLQEFIPPMFFRYRLSASRGSSQAGRFIHPPVSFENDLEAVAVTVHASRALSAEHDRMYLETNRLLANKAL